MRPSADALATLSSARAARCSRPGIAVCSLEPPRACQPARQPRARMGILGSCDAALQHRLSAAEGCAALLSLIAARRNGDAGHLALGHQANGAMEHDSEDGEPKGVDDPA